MARADRGMQCGHRNPADNSHEDNDESQKSAWSNWCGAERENLQQDYTQRIWSDVLATRPPTSSTASPSFVFQILRNDASPSILLSWPPPRLFPSTVTAPRHFLGPDPAFTDGSYFASDFAALAQGISASGQAAGSDASTSCTRRVRGKHSLTTEARLRTVESVLIPYGAITFACFSITFDQPLVSAIPDPLPSVAELKPRLSRLPTPPPSIKTSSTGQKRNSVSEDGVRRSHARTPSPPEGTAQKKKRQKTIKGSGDAAQVSSAAAYNSQPYNESRRSSLGLDSLASAASLDAQALALAGRESEEMPPPPPPSKAKSSRAKAAQSQPSNNSSHSVSPTSTASLGKGKRVDGEQEGAASRTSPTSAVEDKDKKCGSCGVANSPEWRKGPTGEKTLCNACGLRYARSVTRLRKKEENARKAAEMAASVGIFPQQQDAHQTSRDDEQLSKSTTSPMSGGAASPA
ncbi:hypothetical protein IE81DRAFT_181495 [Ceraceosorus guamensis]|uniref:GATA-type domain-containing protein n=1 Tax=Ceraceosorus guamensis TaxID=1522189 RepID=A0A316VY58_9BASI|nr:hypothetical protein IE81DRAFT_181495 [Ceraceosorus guamensis]PWN41231.1 hypothetical protein IE81DRAFT_181495 [Ceraceosorus guamensis]